MLTVRLHRWQSNKNRYRTQNFNLDLESGNSFFGLLGMTAHIEGQPMVKPSESHVVARTQQVDMIEVDLFKETIEIWMSPGKERNYKPRKRHAQVERMGGGHKVNEIISAPTEGGVTNRAPIGNKPPLCSECLGYHWEFTPCIH
jgi:hypothetical protein